MKTFAPLWRRLSPGTLQSALVLERPHWLEERSVRALRALCGLFPLVLPGCFSQSQAVSSAMCTNQGSGKDRGSQMWWHTRAISSWDKGMVNLRLSCTTEKNTTTTSTATTKPKQTSRQTEWLLSVSVKFSGQLSLLCLPTAWSFRKPCSSQL